MDETAAEPRALEILESVKAIFASKGFDGASMQDLARAAGMSAGNFYRYFPSKNAIVEAIVERELAEVRTKFAEVIRAPDPLPRFRAMVRHRIEGPPDMDGPIWAEIEAAAGRRPEFAALLERMEAEIVRNLVAVFARIADVPLAEAEARFTAHARLMILLVQGVAMRCGARGPEPDRADGFAPLVSRLIDFTLSEVVAAGRTADAPAN
jgi:AcrR family transcriptional regulator